VVQGTVGAAYQVNDYLGLSVGMATAQAPKTPDNQSFRFPFFAARADNLTVFDFTITGSY